MSKLHDLVSLPEKLCSIDADFAILFIYGHLSRPVSLILQPGKGKPSFNNSPKAIKSRVIDNCCRFVLDLVVDKFWLKFVL